MFVFLDKTHHISDNLAACVKYCVCCVLKGKEENIILRWWRIKGVWEDCSFTILPVRALLVNRVRIIMYKRKIENISHVVNRLEY